MRDECPGSLTGSIYEGSSAMAAGRPSCGPADFGDQPIGAMCRRRGAARGARETAGRPRGQEFERAHLHGEGDAGVGSPPRVRHPKRPPPTGRMSRVNAASVPGHRPAVLAALQTPDRVLVDLRTGEGALWAEMGPDRRPADLP